MPLSGNFVWGQNPRWQPLNPKITLNGYGGDSLLDFQVKIRINDL
jgi:hypothetical protein